MADNTTELEVLDEIVDALGGTPYQHKTVVPVLEDIRDLLGGGGGGGGYNPSLSVGRADALTGADETAQWAQRESTGSGAATVRSVQGASVVFQQKFRPASRSATSKGITMVMSYDGTLSLSGTATGSEQFTAISENSIDFVSGHKYIAIGPNNALGVSFYTISGNVSLQENNVGTCNADSRERINVAVAASFNVGDTPYVCYPQIFDLTQMFGAGNEPQSVAEFRRMFPEAYYPYSAPTLKPVQIAGIASTDAQGGELDAIEWTAQTLRAAGSVADMLYSDHVDVRVGVVDLGTLNWSAYTASTTGKSIFLATLATSANYTGVQTVPNAKCADYETVSLGNVGSLTTDKVLSLGGYYEAGPNVYVSDSTYTTAADFKAAMSGVLLYYELATPTTTPISPALPMTYRVEQGGSESIIVPDGEVSAAPIITLAEGESAADVIMDALACIAAPDGPTATSNHAINTYLTMGGKLYKVTSAIAVGETITAGTNVSETTVMAELIARTA